MMDLQREIQVEQIEQKENEYIQIKSKLENKISDLRLKPVHL